MIGSLDRDRLNVVTLEDPVEYRLAGLAQVQVHTRAGLTFATALRSVLRQDPDVVLVGEMRDKETVEVGMAAALTGHLVLSTLHTVDAPGAVARLLDMGAPPYLVAGALVGVLAQRVVRRVCPRCRAEHQPEPCPDCGGEGYRGRVGVYELMEVNDGIAELILRRAGAAELRRAAIRDGMVPMDEDARAKVAAGLTTAVEVA
jgi:type II secretory ATPase GspE/PulE/Tfp pilus assembly ATPase PilB-like protein